MITQDIPENGQCTPHTPVVIVDGRVYQCITSEMTTWKTQVSSGSGVDAKLYRRVDQLETITSILCVVVIVYLIYRLLWAIIK